MNRLRKALSGLSALCAFSVFSSLEGTFTGSLGRQVSGLHLVLLSIYAVLAFMLWPKPEAEASTRAPSPTQF